MKSMSFQFDFTCSDLLVCLRCKWAAQPLGQKGLEPIKQTDGRTNGLKIVRGKKKQRNNNHQKDFYAFNFRFNRWFIAGWVKWKSNRRNYEIKYRFSINCFRSQISCGNVKSLLSQIRKAIWFEREKNTHTHTKQQQRQKHWQNVCTKIKHGKRKAKRISGHQY